MDLLKGNDPIPDIGAADYLGEPVNGKEILSGGRRLALFFLRYVGCPVCQMRFWELEKNQTEYEKRKTTVIVVLQSRPEILKKLHAQKPFSLRVIADPKGRLYREFGVERASWRSYFSWPTLKGAARATMAGYMHGRPEGDERQKPADFLVDSDGKILLAHYGAHIADNLPDEELLEYLDAAGEIK